MIAVKEKKERNIEIYLSRDEKDAPSMLLNKDCFNFMQTYRESPRNYKYFFVHITFMKVGKCYNTVFHISITKATKTQQ